MRSITRRSRRLGHSLYWRNILEQTLSEADLDSISYHSQNGTIASFCKPQLD